MNSFWCQFKVLLWRNILLKRRNRAQLFQEFLMPLFFVILLSVIKGMITPSSFGQHGAVGPVSLKSSRFQPNTSIPILVAPNTSTVESVMNWVSLDLGGVPYKILASQEEAEREYLAHPASYSLGLIFNYHGSNLSFAIRTPFRDIPNTKGSPYIRGDVCRQNVDSNQFDSSSNCTTTMYLYSGFMALQRSVATALLQVQTEKPDVKPPDVLLEQMPMPSYQQNFSYILILSSMYFVLAYSPFINFLTVNLVGEKERKIKEGMRMMGMKDSAFWLAWGSIYAVIIIIVSVLVVIIALIAKFFEHSNLFILFLMLVLYGLSIINVSFMVTPFFNKATTAGVVSSMASMLISVLYLAVSLTRTYTPTGFQYTVGPAGQWALCILSPVAMALAMDRGLYLDLSDEGMTFDTMTSGDFPLYAPLLMMFLDFILYGLLAVYFDNVIPTEYGQRRSAFFFLQPSYWCGQQAKVDEYSSLLDRQRQYEATSLGPNIEPVAGDLQGKEGLRISHLGKVFGGGSCCNKNQVVAVDDLTLDMYDGQITAVLGHNGAGKTTLINILTGMTPATSGRATILGLDVTNTSEMSTIRTMTGVCSQHNILFDSLSAREHLDVYAGIKGVPSEKRKQVVEQSLLDVDLADHGDTRGKSLSGGQKRKLSVAIALIGDPKVIFLDEPTAGMDPYSRRHLWSLLTARKQGKIILLTTHFMDEADILADRKAIIAKGQLKCCGSSLFLKNKFGIGYHLNMVLEDEGNIADVTNLIQSHVPDVCLVRSHGKELAYTLPFETVNKFPDLFTSLEETQSNKGTAASLGISSYGVSMTTLEEVFLRLGDEFDETEMTTLSTRVSPSKTATDTPPTLTMEANSDATGSVMVEFEPTTFDPSKTSARLIPTSSLSFQRFKALLYIRFLQQIREPATIIFQLTLPIVYVIIGIILSNHAHQSSDEQSPVSLDLSRGLGYYVQIRGVKLVSTPLLFDNSAGPGGKAFKQAFSTFISLDEFNSSTDLLADSPHMLGVHITTANLTTDMFDLGFTGLFNTTSVHSIPVLLNLMLNAMYQALSGASNQSTLITFSLPWNSTEGVYSYDGAAFGSAMLLAMAFVAVSTGFTSHIVRDKQCHGRSQLRVSGVTHYMYWSTYFTIYQIMYLIPTIIILLIIPIAKIQSLLYGGAIVSLIILLLLYMPMNILFSFIWSFAFTTLETAQTVVPNIFNFGGILPYLGVSLVDMQGGDLEKTASMLNLVFCIIDPTYTVFGGIYYIGKVDRMANIRHTDVQFGDYFEWDSDIPICLLMAAVHCVWMFLLIPVLEVHSTGRDIRGAIFCTTAKVQAIPGNNTDIVNNEDSDVANERQRVATWAVNEEEPVVMVKNLRKEFEKETSAVCSCFSNSGTESKLNVAVRNISFAVEAGEVFGLLGPNGAGKTTTLNMIQVEIGATCGEITVAGYDVRSSLSDAFQQMGSCPQHDALWDRITLREHIRLYGLLKGISKADIEDTTNYFIKSLQIEEHADKHAKITSGGTKRKTCYAISMLGQPKIVLLDEPSTGMDPKSKRFLWDTISSGFRSQEKGGILTTHYMEEADVLCSRVAIMVNGQMQCIGSTQHLKNKYGSGYILEVKLDPLRADNSNANRTDQMTALDGYIKSLFDQAERTESFGGRAMYKIPQDNVKALSHVFIALEEAKSQFGVSEYSFSQSSLEQVFLEFAKKQVEEGDSGKFEGEGVTSPNYLGPATA